MNRRKFLGALSAGSAHLLFSHPLYASGENGRSANPLQNVHLGRSGLTTTLLGFGTGIKAGNRTSFLTKQEEARSIATLRYAIDRGLRFFDCADTYGTHGLVRQALQGRDREALTISSKIWTRQGGIPEPERPDANIVVDRFRKELGTDYLDLVQLHCMVDADWTDSMKRQMDILDNLKARGIIRAHGVSVHSIEAMKAALKDPWVDVIHVRINPYGIAMDKPEPEEVVAVIHQLHAAGKGVIGMKLVGNGQLKKESEKIDHTLKFVLGLGSVDMMIIGFESGDEIDNYIERMETALKSVSERV